MAVRQGNWGDNLKKEDKSTICYKRATTAYLPRPFINRIAVQVLAWNNPKCK